jgi:hypothetical protein
VVATACTSTLSKYDVSSLSLSLSLHLYNYYFVGDDDDGCVGGDDDGCDDDDSDDGDDADGDDDGATMMATMMMTAPFTTRKQCVPREWFRHRRLLQRIGS